MKICSRTLIFMIVLSGRVFVDEEANGQSVEGIREQFLERYVGMDEFQIHVRRKDEATIPLAELASLFNMSALIDWEEIIAHKKGKFYLKKIERSVNARGSIKRDVGGKSKEVVNTKQPALTKTKKFDGEHFVEFSDGGMGVIDSLSSKNKRMPGRTFDILYMQLVGWFVSDLSADPARDSEAAAAYFPQDMMLARSTFREEESDNRKHLVVELVRTSGYRDIYWLDRDKNMMIRRKEVFEPISDRRVVEVHNSDEKEILPGFWLPMKSKRIQNLRKSEPPFQEAALTTTIKVENINIGEVADDLFVISFPGNVMMADFAATERAGLPFDNPVFRSSLDISGRVKQPSSWKLIVANLAIFGSLGAYTLYRMYCRKGTKEKE